jgi:hypothetical protein
MNSVALAKDLICRGCLQDETSGRAPTFAVFKINVTSATCFDLIRPSSGGYFYVIAALYSVF